MNVNSCNCKHCKLARSLRKRTKKNFKGRAKASRPVVKEMLRTYDPDVVQDYLPTAVSVDYYA